MAGAVCRARPQEGRKDGRPGHARTWLPGREGLAWLQLGSVTGAPRDGPVIRMQVAIGFDYVLVLEWLRKGDEPTGAGLHVFLPSIAVDSELCVCQSWEDVRRALNDAAAAVGRRGIPAVHLETHGSNPWIEAAEDIRLGLHHDSRPAWGQLGPLLAPLNVAAGFRLLFVSAACWDSGIMAAIMQGSILHRSPAPLDFAQRSAKADYVTPCGSFIDR